MRQKLTILLMLVLCTRLLATDPFQLIRTAGGTARYPNADLLTVYDSTLSDVQETGLTYVNRKVLYKVLTPEGAKTLHVVKFDYDPLSAYVEIKSASIYRADGTIEQLPVREVRDYPAPARAIYWGARQIMIEVGKLYPGDALEVHMFRKGFTYALLQQGDDDNYIPPMKGHFYDIVEFWDDNPILNKTYITHIPNSKQVQYKFYNGNAQIREYEENGKNVYSFTMYNQMPMKREPNMVAWSDVAPKLLISTSPDWEAKSLWFYGVNEDFGSFETTPEINTKVNEILKGAMSEMDTVERLTHWVADNIRYSGLSMGEGEGYTLHKGEMTFLDRCGVCKDKAGMLITMLRAVGFESYAAMTMAGSRIDSIPADQFNHSVTVVKLSDGKYHLLDPTWVPFVRELWSSAEQQQHYLMGVPEGAGLMETPVSPAENHYVNITVKTSLTENGTLTGTIEVEAEGQSDARLRGNFTRSRKVEWENTVQQLVQDIHPSIQINYVEYDEPYAYMDGPMNVKFEFSIPNYAVVTNEEIILTPISATELFKPLQAHLYINTGVENREYAFRDRCSRLVTINEELALPQSYSPVYLPEEKNGEGTGANYMLAYSFTENQLILNQELEFHKRVYTAEDWPSFKAAVDAQKTYANDVVILKKLSENEE